MEAVSPLLAILADKAIRGSADTIGHLLTIMSGAFAVNATSRDLAVAMFRARAAAWFRGERG